MIHLKLFLLLNLYFFQGNTVSDEVVSKDLIGDIQQDARQIQAASEESNQCVHVLSPVNPKYFPRGTIRDVMKTKLKLKSNLLNGFFFFF